MSAKTKSARSTSTKVSNLLSDEERAAMKETLKERRRALSGEADGESDVLAKIGEMPEPDRGSKSTGESAYPHGNLRHCARSRRPGKVTVFAATLLQR